MASRRALDRPDPADPADPPDLPRLTRAIEDFNSIFIRLPSVRRLNFSALSVLHTLDRSGPLRLTDLLATEQLKQPAISSLVNRLAADGLLVRGPDPTDGRAVLLSLTADGRQIVRSRHRDRITSLGRLVDRLDDDERAVLTDTTRVLVRLVEIAKELGNDGAAPTSARSVAADSKGV
ncbi:MarR family winged helix-turn-helix transcriptional regulator [Nakamurella lactea]|uniref:MarR family winged helix-turn-helix transcriptional regulator n=1 Tax=Nakamurella lactea TaxID=459515 RepID=UPI00041F44B6|nr:MarR family transcriptional regulator [Nakamurella lactea]